MALCYNLKCVEFLLRWFYLSPMTIESVENICEGTQNSKYLCGLYFTFWLRGKQVFCRHWRWDQSVKITWLAPCQSVQSWQALTKGAASQQTWQQLPATTIQIRDDLWWSIVVWDARQKVPGLNLCQTSSDGNEFLRLAWTLCQGSCMYI